jgi:uncharacterized protein
MTAPTRRDPEEQILIPDFTGLDFARQGCRCPAYAMVTPRNAAALWAAAIKLADTLDAQIVDIKDRIPLSTSEWGRLPWVVTDARVEWFGRFVDGVLGLADDVASGRCPIPRCTGEDVALHLAIEDLMNLSDGSLIDLTATAKAGLPVLDWDDNWDDLAPILFPDARMRHLIADGFDGIDDDYELVAETGIVRLAVHRWFEPFDELMPERPESICGCPVITSGQRAPTRDAAPQP